MKSNLEQLERDPALAILPSGIAISLRGVVWAGESTEREFGHYLVSYRDAADVWLAEARDIAAVKAALYRIGVPIEAPTLAGEDADGDGVVGES